jgi:hypothetical protein
MRPYGLHAVEGGATDHVARFNSLRAEFPEASFTFDGGWFYGALRDDDDVIRAASLRGLIGALLAREGTPPAPPMPDGGHD